MLRETDTDVLFAVQKAIQVMKQGFSNIFEPKFVMNILRTLFM